MLADTAARCRVRSTRGLCGNFSRDKFAGTGPPAVFGAVPSRERRIAAVFSPFLPRSFNRKVKSVELGL